MSDGLAANPLADELTVSRRPGLIEAEIDGELIGLHIDNGVCYGFNRTATRIWRLIEHPKSLADICRALTREFAVDHQECAAEVVCLLREMRRDGLIDMVETPGRDATA